MANQGVMDFKVHMYLIREACAILTSLLKHKCSRNYFEQEFFGTDTNGIKFGTNKNYQVHEVHTAIKEIIWKIFYVLDGKRKGTIGDSKCKFKENNHHAISTHWYKVVYVTFYSLVHIFMETLSKNSKIGNDNF